MSRILLLAWRYIAFHKGVSLILLVSITATFYLPFTVDVLTNRMEAQLFARADTTPLIAGAKGSRFDLTLNALYFEARAPFDISLADFNQIAETGLAEAIPLHVRYRAHGFPVVGTSLDYFDFRNLRVAEGEPLRSLGDCVIGANVAEALDLHPGDHLISDPENVFDIGGNYPLKMKVAGGAGEITVTG